MGRYSTILFLILLSTAVCCSRQRSGKDVTTPKVPSRKAEGISWVRSEIDRANSMLRQKWVLRAASAKENPVQKAYELTTPSITYYPESDETVVTIISQKAAFYEADNRIVFQPASFLQRAQVSAGSVKVSLISETISYIGQKSLLICSGKFHIFRGSTHLEASGFSYDLEKELIQILRDINVTFPAPEKSEKGLLFTPWGYKKYTSLFRDTGHITKQHNIITAKNKSEFNIKTDIFTVNGPLTFISTEFLFKAQKVILAGERLLCEKPYNSPYPEQIKAQGNILFRETTGLKREVTCRDLYYSSVEDRVIMTGSPRLKGRNEQITSSRIIYHPEEKTFTFHRPYKIIHKLDAGSKGN